MCSVREKEGGREGEREGEREGGGGREGKERTDMCSPLLETIRKVATN